MPSAVYLSCQPSPQTSKCPSNKPSRFLQTIQNLKACLRPGGILFFRDYGLYDLSQIRAKQGRCIGRNFYIRGDGTCAYFFQQGNLIEDFGCLTVLYFQMK